MCPKCWKNNLDYATIEIECEACFYPWTCKDCGTQWEERYSMRYDWQYNLLDKDWNDLFINKEQDEN